MTVWACPDCGFSSSDGRDGYFGPAEIHMQDEDGVVRVHQYVNCRRCGALVAFTNQCRGEE